MELTILQDPYSIAASAYWLLSSKRHGQFLDNLHKTLECIEKAVNLNPWQKREYKARIEDFARLKQELEELGYTLKLTEAEQYSPESGAALTFRAYCNEVLDDKIELLRNALLNGMYGNHTTEQRELFYKIIDALQPLDIAVLNYLISICPSVSFFRDLVLEGETTSDKRQKIFLASSLYVGSSVSGRENGGLVSFAKKENISIDQLTSSINRLVNTSLVYCQGSHWDFNDPYSGCTPTDQAQSFLNFLSDPQKVLTHDTAIV